MLKLSISNISLTNFSVIVKVLRYTGLIFHNMFSILASKLGCQLVIVLKLHVNLI
jgi:hypothetical protein